MGVFGGDPEGLGVVGYIMRLPPFLEIARSESVPWCGDEHRKHQTDDFLSMCAKESPLHQEDSASNPQASPL